MNSTSSSPEKQSLLGDKLTPSDGPPTLPGGHERRRKQRNRDVTLAMGLLLAVKASVVMFVFLFCLSQGRRGLGSGFGAKRGGQLCVQPSPPAQPSNWSALYDHPDFAMESAQRLSGAVKIPTQLVRDDPTRTAVLSPHQTPAEPPPQILRRHGRTWPRSPMGAIHRYARLPTQDVSHSVSQLRFPGD